LYLFKVLIVSLKPNHPFKAFKVLGDKLEETKLFHGVFKSYKFFSKPFQVLFGAHLYSTKVLGPSSFFGGQGSHSVIEEKGEGFEKGKGKI
jgi:hypothetical protein